MHHTAARGAHYRGTLETKGPHSARWVQESCARDVVGPVVAPHKGACLYTAVERAVAGIVLEVERYTLYGRTGDPCVVPGDAWGDMLVLSKCVESGTCSGQWAKG